MREVLIREHEFRRSHEESLQVEGVSRGMILAWIQRMADIDIAALHGGPVPSGGLLGLMAEMQKYGWFDDDVWQVYAKP